MSSRESIALALLTNADAVLCDQRHFARPKGAGCDIGAVEVLEPFQALLLVTGAVALVGVYRFRSRRARHRC